MAGFQENVYIAVKKQKSEFGINFEPIANMCIGLKSQCIFDVTLRIATILFVNNGHPNLRKVYMGVCIGDRFFTLAVNEEQWKRFGEFLEKYKLKTTEEFLEMLKK